MALFRILLLPPKRNTKVKKRYNASKKLVLLSLFVAGLSCSLMTMHAMNMELMMASMCYYFLFWVFPATIFIVGLFKRERKKLLVWIFTVGFHFLIIFTYSLYTVTTSLNKSDEILAITLLALSPLLIVPLINPLMIFFTMKKRLQHEAREAAIELESGETGELELPSYSELEAAELPMYKDLGAKQLRLGSRVILVDKNLKLSTFKMRPSEIAETPNI